MSHNGYTACGKTYRYRNDYLEEFHHYADDRSRNLRVLFLPEYRVKRAVFAAHIKHRRHGKNYRYLRKKTCHSEREHPFYGLCGKTESRLFEFYCFQSEQINKCEYRGNYLTQNGCDRGARHAPFESINEYRVENTVADRTRKQRDHRKRRASVRTDYRIQPLPEHIKRDAERDPKEVFPRHFKRFFVDRRAERFQYRIRENKVYRRKYNSRRNKQKYGVSDAFFRFLGSFCSEIYACERTAAVSYHRCYRQGN